MPYLREYIRKVLAVKEEGTIVFLESPVQYDPGAILKECLELASGFDLVNENMDLAFFHQNVDGEVDGAAWVENMGKFNFAIATAEGSSDFVFESLVQDCLDEFFILSRKNKNLILEIHSKHQILITSGMEMVAEEVEEGTMFLGIILGAKCSQGLDYM